MSPVDLMGRMPRDTRKRRIRASEHKIRRMDLKGFERIVAHGPLPLPLSSCLQRKFRPLAPFTAPTNIRAPRRKRVYSSSSEWIESTRFSSSEACGGGGRRKTMRAIRRETHFGVFTRAVGMHPPSERESSTPRGMSRKLRQGGDSLQNVYYRFEKRHARIAWCHASGCLVEGLA